MGQIRRRQVVLVSAALFLAPLRAFPAPKVWQVGFLAAGSRVPYVDAFIHGMRELGYRDRENVLFRWRFADGHYDRLATLAMDLVNNRVDIIVCAGTLAIEAARKATTDIPIVMALAGDPVASGFVPSLARPGGNITGLSLDNTDTFIKWFELARTVAPGSRIGVLGDPNQPPTHWYIKGIQSVAQKEGLKVPVAYAATVNEIQSAFASLAKDRVKTVIVLAGGLFSGSAKEIGDRALQRRMATIATTSGYAEGGALLSYGQNYNAFTARAATYVDKIFKGARPGDLPIEQPMTFELVVNLATAKRLGLTIPKEIVLRADKVIE